MREQLRTMDVAAYAEGHDFNLTGRGEALRLTGTLVSAELFSILVRTQNWGEYLTEARILLARTAT